MKIKKLWVSKYKNIENIEFSFDSNLISLFVGKNGLGKSNFIEILALIFRQLEIVDNETDLILWAQANFYFSLIYECHNREVNISVIYNPETRQSDCTVHGIIFGPNGQQIVFNNLLGFKKIKEQFLPTYIIGYYSGENKRIKNIVKEQERAEKQFLLRQARNPDKDFLEKMRRLFFAENHHSKLILLALSLYASAEDYRARMQELFNHLQIESIISFSVKFNNPDWNYLGISGIDKGMENLIANMTEGNPNPFWNFGGKVHNLLFEFYNYQIANSNPYHYPADKGEDERNYVNEYLQYNDVETSQFHESVKAKFPTPIEFFDAIETTWFMGAGTNVSFKVKKTGVEEVIDYEQLSEGEQQLLTVLGLILLFGKEDCLFLLDEPDTHLNPKWQREYVELLKKFDDNSNNSHMIVATHSPLIVQAAETADIFLFRKNSDDKIEVDNNNDLKIHNWRIDQVLASEYFEFVNTRPPALDEFMEIREALLSKPELTEEDIEQIRDYMEDPNLLPSGETLNDFKAMHLVHSIANQSREV
jgi:predicted ATPase